MNEQMNTDYESSKPNKTQVKEIQVPNELDLGKKWKYQSNSWLFSFGAREGQDWTNDIMMICFSTSETQTECLWEKTMEPSEGRDFIGQYPPVLNKFISPDLTMMNYKPHYENNLQLRSLGIKSSATRPEVR